jgi:hypothetical protein
MLTLSAAIKSSEVLRSEMICYLRRYPTVAVGLAFLPHPLVVVGRISRLARNARVDSIIGKNMTKYKTRVGEGLAARRVAEPETIDKREAVDLLELSERVNSDTRASVAKRIRKARLKDDLIRAQVNRTFNDFLRSLPVDDFNRETLELDRGHLVERCERAKTSMRFTQALSDVRKYVRLKARIAVIDLMLSSEVAVLIEASSRHNDS